MTRPLRFVVHRTSKTALLAAVAEQPSSFGQVIVEGFEGQALVAWRGEIPVDVGKRLVDVRARALVIICTYIFVDGYRKLELERLVAERSRGLCRSTTLRLILGNYERLHSSTHGCKLH